MRRVLLQNSRTGRYLSADETWVEDCRQAKEFEWTHLALREGLSRRDIHCQLVWCFGNPGLNLYFGILRSEGVRCGKCPLKSDPAL